MTHSALATLPSPMNKKNMQPTGTKQSLKRELLFEKSCFQEGFPPILLIGNKNPGLRRIVSIVSGRLGLPVRAANYGKEIHTGL
jgi:hypothetical protein